MFYIKVKKSIDLKKDLEQIIPTLEENIEKLPCAGQMVELVDALVSGPSARKSMGVQIPLRPPDKHFMFFSK